MRLLVHGLRLCSGGVISKHLTKKRSRHIENISPVFIEVDEVKNINNNLTVFTSASGDQVSSWYPDKKHSLYTYYFLKGLKGEADNNNNNSITINEIHNYAKNEVSRMARKLNSRTQSPELRTSNGNKELINY